MHYVMWLLLVYVSLFLSSSSAKLVKVSIYFEYIHLIVPRCRFNFGVMYSLLF